MDPIKIPISKKMQTLTYDDFINVRLIADMDNITDINWKQLSGIVYDDQQLITLNVFMYYIINIGYNLEIPQLESLYINKISKCYFQGKYQIQITKFAKFCAKLLGFPEEYCFHLCYFLVYGKLASNPYIKAMLSGGINKNISQKIDRKNINQIMKSKRSSRQFSTHKIKKLTQLKEQQFVNQTSQYDLFAQQLQNIFKSPQRAQKTHKSQEQDIKNQTKIWQGSTSQRKYYLSYFPKRVQNTEKSAIIQSIYPSHTNIQKKVRKIRFDPDQIGYQNKIKDKYASFTDKTVDDDKQNCRNHNRKNSKLNKNIKLQKSDLHKLNINFKNKSDELDIVRQILKQPKNISNNKNCQNTLYNRNRNQKVHPQHKQSLEKSYLKLKKLVSESSKFSMDQQQNNQNNINTRKFIEYQQQNKFQEISKKLNPKSNRLHTNNTTEDKDENQKDYGDILKLSCKNRLYHYRTQYRSFMRTHVFNLFQK